MNALLQGTRIDHVLMNPLLNLALPGLDAALRSGAHPEWQLVAELGRTTLWRRHP